MLIFLPLEIAFGFLQKIGEYLSGFLLGGDAMRTSGFNFIKPLVKPPVKFLQDTVLGGLPSTATGIIMVLLGVVAIFVVIYGIPVLRNIPPWAANKLAAA